MRTRAACRFDHMFSDRDQLSVHFTRAVGVECRSAVDCRRQRSGVSGGRGHYARTRAAVSETHLFSGATVNSLRAGFFRNVFVTDSPLNRTSPRQLGFNYDSTLSRGRRAAVLHRQRLCQRRQSDHGAARHDAEYVRGVRFALAHTRGAQLQVRRGFPAQPDQHDARGLRRTASSSSRRFRSAIRSPAFWSASRWCFFRAAAI